MKAKELKDMPKTELQNLLIENKTRLEKLRFEQTGNKSKNNKEVSQVKKDIARLLTMLRMKAI
jgi:ribosomal protein L29